MNENDLLKIRFDYAWKWFDYHAKQRTTLFNYYLIIIGIFANAYIVLMKEEQYTLASGIAVIACVLSVGFFCLDRRNRQLVRWGESVLRKLEETDIFTGFTEGKVQLGFTLREQIESINKGKLTRLKDFFINHTFWLTTIQLGLALIFLFLSIYGQCIISYK